MVVLDLDIDGDGRAGFTPLKLTMPEQCSLQHCKIFYGFLNANGHQFKGLL